MARVELRWDPFDPNDPGPCIDVLVMNSHEVIQAGNTIGLEYPGPRPLRALLDTGASITVISKKFAEYCKLRQTNEGSEISAIGAVHRCGEHAGSISFPDTDLRTFDPIRIVSAVFAKERYYACLIGRDILRNWLISFDGRGKRVIIEERV
jgi:predicted aspartyl protease